MHLCSIILFSFQYLRHDRLKIYDYASHISLCWIPEGNLNFTEGSKGKIEFYIYIKMHFLILLFYILRAAEVPSCELCCIYTTHICVCVCVEGRVFTSVGFAFTCLLDSSIRKEKNG